MAPPRILLTGSSHVVSIRNAQNLRRARGQATFELVDVELFPRFDPLLRTVNGEIALHEGIAPGLREAIDARAPKFVVGAFWGNQHFFMSAANLPRRVDFVLPAEPDLPLDPQATLVPHDVLYAWLRQHFVVQDLLTNTLRSLTAAPIYALPAPPPVEDFAAVPTGSSSKAIDALVAEHGVAPSGLRYKFWRLVEAIHTDIAAASGVRLIPLPPGAADAAGFRRREYYFTDWIHANTDYGELVLRQFDALLAQA